MSSVRKIKIHVRLFVFNLTIVILCADENLLLNRFGMSLNYQLKHDNITRYCALVVN